MDKLFIAFLILLSNQILAQKPVIDENAVNTWPIILDEQISNDGKHIIYSVGNQFTRSKLEMRTVYLVSCNNSFKKVLTNIKEITFSEDGKYVIYLNSSGKLVLFNLVTKDEESFDEVYAYKLAFHKGNHLIAIKFHSGNLLLRSFDSRLLRNYSNVARYDFSTNGKLLWIEMHNENLDSYDIDLMVVNTELNIEKKLWSGFKINQIIFDNKESQIAFIAQKVESSATSLWYYNEQMDSAILWLDNSKMKEVEMYNRRISFNPKSNALFFYIKEKKVNKATVKSDVFVWSYADEYNQFDYLDRLKARANAEYLCLIYVGARDYIKIGQDYDNVNGPILCNYNSKYACVNKEYNPKTAYKNLTAGTSIVVIDLEDGTRECIEEMCYVERPYFSSNGKFIVWYNRIDNRYYSFNFSTKVKKAITPNQLEFESLKIDGTEFGEGGIAGWLSNDEAVLVYDKYDIWLFDPNGISKPVNITKGYGRANRIRFRCVYMDGRSWHTESPFGKNDSILLCAFDEKTKMNGFYKLSLRNTNVPSKLIMSPRISYLPASISNFSTTNFIRKAKTANAYLVKRMNANEYPNLFFTTDFNGFVQISDLQPQREYNWLTCELVKWRTYSGKEGHGILYKPEGFSEKKKYPLIVHIYRTLSVNLYQFPPVEFSTGSINIPWFVSRGYVVFCPDIYYEVGDPGKGVYDYVISGVSFLTKKNWIDPNKMGIQGHSWGGYEVNYLITQTSIFSAAVSAAGPTNFVSCYTLDGFAACAGPYYTELGAYLMGKSLWEIQDNYIRNSPIFGANRVQSPIMIMHNKLDRNVAWEQGWEFFTALKHLGKKVWMLEYADQGHSLPSHFALDYSIRMTQFFDHYLKGLPPARWMTNSLSPHPKGDKMALQDDK